MHKIFLNKNIFIVFNAKIKTMEIERLILKACLKNAYKHEGKCILKSVVSSLIGENPEIKKDLKNLMPKINELIKYVNSLSFDQIEVMVKKEFPEILEEKPKCQEKELELSNVSENVIVRFSPNPSGPLHLGHSRVAILNDYFAKKYKGKFILRLEDTDPKRVLSEAYDMILDDLNYLEIKVDNVVIQSDRFKIYYNYCEELIKKGFAYVCNCDPVEFRKNRDLGIECSCRSRDIEENLELWEKMKIGEIENVVVRLKTDMKHKNKSIRDFPIFRVDKTPHPRTGDRYFAYPLMNFSVPIDDYLLGITHIIRGKDHILNTEKQKYIYKYFGWKEPTFIHIGILKIEGIPLSTSKMYEGINSGIYSGWDDIRLGTLKAMKKRGIKSESIREFILKFGLSQRDITVPVDDLYKINKRLIDKEAIRLFSVFDPVKIIVKNCPKTVCKHKLYVDREEYNYIKVREGINEFYIEKDELFDEIRLKDLFNIKRIKDNIFEFNGFELKKGLKKVEWLLEGCFREYTLVDKKNKERKIFVEDVDFDCYAQLERKFYVHKIGGKLYYCHE